MPLQPSPPFEENYERRGNSVQSLASEPDKPDEPLPTGKYVAVEIADTELSISETAATQTSWVSGKSPPPEHRACGVPIRDTNQK
ncbi:hypothetical protein E4U17_007992 [Claviceps sp. LM77 group G4]|nr:hypothetical protein E4U17_007992 [Claviceps sp. LM77 group G4]